MGEKMEEAIQYRKRMKRRASDIEIIDSYALKKMQEETERYKKISHEALLEWLEEKGSYNGKSR